MLVTERSNQHNQKMSVIAAIVTALVILGLALLSPWWLLALPLALLVYRFLRRRTKRRLKVMASPMHAEWEQALIENVAFFRALNDEEKVRFRNMVKVFIDEVPITGIRTDVDETTRALVAASAAIPVFGFDHWEYSGLGEVLIYPGAFGDDYRTDEGVNKNTLGMVGVAHLSGVMILSKPDLISGFRNPQDKRNVGIHEFAHLVDKADGAVDGIPAGIPRDTVAPWIGWVGEELRRDPRAREEIDDYAYTNEAEYFAVLSEYFFEAPDVLQKRHPEVYNMMKNMYHQDTQSFLSVVMPRRKRVGRNSPCPCGSGEKFKRCCGRKTRQGIPTAA